MSVSVSSVVERIRSGPGNGVVTDRTPV